MLITGGCHCGDIKYRTKGDPDNALICHCTDCQIMSGSVYRTVLFVDAQDFELLSGEPKEYIKVADDGAKRAMVFCPECGTQIYAEAEEKAERNTLGIRLGTSDQRNDIVPKSEKFQQSKLDWVNGLT